MTKQWKNFVKSTKEKADVHAKIARFWSGVDTMFGLSLILTSGIKLAYNLHESQWGYDSYI